MDTAIDTLLARSSELTRERAELTSRIKAIDADIATLKRAAEILKPGSGQTINAEKRKTAGRPSGNFTMAMLEVLRDAPQPLTAAEVGRLALVHTGQLPDAVGRSALTSRATTALKKYSNRGTVVRLDNGDGALLWTVAR